MDKKLLILVGIFFVTFGTFVSIVFTRSQTQPALIKAQQAQNINVEKSLIFAVPKGNGCEISVVINDNDSKPVKDVSVCIESDPSTFTPICKNTDESGISTMSLLNISSRLTISAKANGSLLPSTVSCYPKTP